MTVAVCGYAGRHGSDEPLTPIAALLKAYRWYWRAADQGSAVGQEALAYLLACGDGVQRDEAEAVRWWRKAVPFPIDIEK